MIDARSEAEVVRVNDEAGSHEDRRTIRKTLAILLNGGDDGARTRDLCRDRAAL